MTRQLSTRQAMVLGGVVLAGIVLAGWVLWGLDQRRGLGRDSFTLQTSFADIAGVQVGARVRIQGIDAGEVEAIEAPARPGDDVVLRLRLSGKFRHLVTDDARVQIANENLLAGKVLRIVPGKAGTPIEEGAKLASMPSTEFTDTLAQASTRFTAVLQNVDKVLSRVDAAVADLEKSNGSLAKFVKKDEVYTETLHSLQDVRRMVTSVKQNSDAIKSMPVVRSYVVDTHKELVRPDCKRLSKWYPASDLFEPNRAVLTEAGRKQLDAGAAWLGEHKEPGSELVVAAYESPEQDADVAQTLTTKRSEAVHEYLRNTHRVHRTGWWWWSTRPMKAVGAGNNPPAVPGTEKLPPSRVELLVFVPGA